MRRTTILVPVLVACAIGMVVGGRLLPAEAERPAPPRPADCEHWLATRDQEVRAARAAATRAAERTEAIRATAAANAAEGARKVRELEKILARERVVSKRLEQQLPRPPQVL